MKTPRCERKPALFLYLLGSQPAQNIGLFTLTGQRALLARNRSHTLSDFRFFVPVLALCTLLRLLLSHGNTLFPFVTTSIRLPVLQ